MRGGRSRKLKAELGTRGRGGMKYEEDKDEEKIAKVEQEKKLYRFQGETATDIRKRRGKR